MEGISKLPAAGNPAVTPHARGRRVETLTRVCTDDLLAAFGLGGLRGPPRTILEAAFRPPARWLAGQVATYDEIVGRSGLAAGGAWALQRMARRVVVEGIENIPREGPLLVVSNHPGLADAVALFTVLTRPELRVVAAGRNFLSELPNTARALIPVSDGPNERVAAVRIAARHLKRGGVVLTFPAGRIEPDPAVLPGAAQALEAWSESVDLFARLVPGLTIVPAVVSGVLSRAALRNPLVYVRRSQRDREWLAATLQMLVPVLRNVTTRVQFGEPIRAERSEQVSRVVVHRTRRMIEALEDRDPRGRNKP